MRLRSRLEAQKRVNPTGQTMEIELEFLRSNSEWNVQNGSPQLSHPRKEKKVPQCEK